MRTKEKRLKFFAADLFRVFRFLAPCFGYLFVKTSSAPHSCNTLIKARGQRERETRLFVVVLISSSISIYRFILLLLLFVSS